MRGACLKFDDPWRCRVALDESGPGVRSLVLSPDREAKRALGRNSLDPAAREASAVAGHLQAERVAAEAAAFWGKA